MCVSHLKLGIKIIGNINRSIGLDFLIFHVLQPGFIKTTDPPTTDPPTTYHLPTEHYPPTCVKIEDQILNMFCIL